MCNRLLILLTSVAALVGSDAYAQTPAEIANLSSGGLGPVSIFITSDGVNADIDAWSGNPNVYPTEPHGCTFFYVDINVNDGGTLSFKYNQRAWGGLWDAVAQNGSPDEDWLDVYLLTPGTTWNPGTIWSQDGSEICWRQDWPSGVIPLIEDFDHRDYVPVCANGTTSCVRESPDLEFTLSLNPWPNQSVRIVFRQWLEGSGDETQSRVRSLSVGNCPVTPLTPLTDPVSLQFEAGNNVDTSQLVPSMQTALACLQTAVINQGGSFPANAIESAYRPPEYQRHLREVYDKYYRLLNNRTSACASIKTQVQDEFAYHNLGRQQPAGPAGPHTEGRAVDLNFGVMGLPPNTIAQLAASCGMSLPLPETDDNHFVVP